VVSELEVDAWLTAHYAKHRAYVVGRTLQEHSLPFHNLHTTGARRYIGVVRGRGRLRESGKLRRSLRQDQAREWCSKRPLKAYLKLPIQVHGLAGLGLLLELGLELGVVELIALFLRDEVNFLAVPLTLHL
jgi:hypothetical protein